jgi:hypothetical protein
MSTTYVPTISSGTPGPLGVLHLPRLWQKVSLEAQGKLASGYPGIGGGYDSMVISALGLQPEAVREFITTSKPSYTDFEAWIKQQPGVKLDSATISELNKSILGYIHDGRNTRRDLLERRIDRRRVHLPRRGEPEQSGRLGGVPSVGAEVEVGLRPTLK